MHLAKVFVKIKKTESTHAFTNTYMHAYIYRYINTYTHMHAYIHTYTHTHKHIHTCIHMHTDMHTHTSPNKMMGSPSSRKRLKRDGIGEIEKQVRQRRKTSLQY